MQPWYSQNELEGVLFAALKAACLPLGLLVLGADLAADPPQSLAVAVHLESAESCAAELQLVPLERDARLSDVQYLELGLGWWVGPKRVDDRLLQFFEAALRCALSLEVARDSDGENGAGAEGWLAG